MIPHNIILRRKVIVSAILTILVLNSLSVLGSNSTDSKLPELQIPRSSGYVIANINGFSCSKGIFGSHSAIGLAWNVGGLSSLDQDALRLAAAEWNDVPVGSSNLHFVIGGSNAQILVENAGLSSGQYAVTREFCNINNNVIPNPVYSLTQVVIQVDDSQLQGYSFYCRVGIIAHELGHSLGLDHTDSQKNGQYPLMNSDPRNNCRTHGTNAPTLDDINGVQSIYGTGGLSNDGNARTTGNGVVSYHNGCCFPINEYVTTPSSGSTASSSTYTSGQTLPSDHVVEIFGTIQVSTAYRFGVGVYAQTSKIDPTTARFATVELDQSTNGAKIVWTDNGNTFADVIGGTNGCCFAGETYWFELTLVNPGSDGSGAKDWIFAEFWDVTQGTCTYCTTGAAFGGSTGQNQTSSTNYGWTQSVNYGTGVWTDSSSNPATNYFVNKYYNYLSSTALLAIAPATTSSGSNSTTTSSSSTTSTTTGVTYTTSGN